VKLVFLGRLREAVDPGFIETPLPAQVDNLESLMHWLTKTRPALATALANGRIQTVVNHILVRDRAHPVRDDDEIAFLPPMSGG
jgi:molybdopterin synthase sulfur carrier subunit